MEPIEFQTRGSATAKLLSSLSWVYPFWGFISCNLTRITRSVITCCASVTCCYSSGVWKSLLSDGVVHRAVPTTGDDLDRVGGIRADAGRTLCRQELRSSWLSCKRWPRLSHAVNPRGCVSVCGQGLRSSWLFCGRSVVPRGGVFRPQLLWVQCVWSSPRQNKTLSSWLRLVPRRFVSMRSR